MAILQIKLCTSIDCEWGGDHPWVTHSYDRHYDDTNFCSACGDPVYTFKKVEAEMEDAETYTEYNESGEPCGRDTYEGEGGTYEDGGDICEDDGEIYGTEDEFHDGTTVNNYQGCGNSNNKSEVHAHGDWAAPNQCEDEVYEDNNDTYECKGNTNRGWEEACYEQDEIYGDRVNDQSWGNNMAEGNVEEWGAPNEDDCGTTQDWSNSVKERVNTPATESHATVGPGPNTEELALADAKKAIDEASRAINDPGRWSWEDVKRAIDEAQRVIYNTKPVKGGDPWGRQAASQAQLAQLGSSIPSNRAAAYLNFLSTPPPLLFSRHAPSFPSAYPSKPRTPSQSSYQPLEW